MSKADPLLLRSLRGEPIERFPVWIMRQAGRYMAEYRQMKERYSFSQMCLTPEVAVEVTLQPIKAFGFDAAILFSDIMIPARALGFDIDFAPGPVVKNPICGPEDLTRISADPDLNTLRPVFDAVKMLRSSLGHEALIGFAATPWTLACYLIDQKPFKHFERSVIWSQTDRKFLTTLLEKLTELTIAYTTEQVRSGAQVIQLFDSWGGILPADLYKEFSLPYANRVFEALKKEGAQTILFVNGASHLTGALECMSADGLSVDSRCALDQLDRQFSSKALQGNLDSSSLFSKEIESHTKRMLSLLTRKTKYVANLGHGVLQGTPREGVQKFVETIKGYSLNG